MIETFTPEEKSRCTRSFWQNFVREDNPPCVNDLLSSLGVPEYSRKNEIACRVGEKISQSIEEKMRSRSITADEALDLAFSYLAYTMEAILHNQDRIAAEMEGDKILGENWSSYDMETYRYVADERLKAEKALRGCQSGDYLGLKQYFAGYGGALGLLPSFIPDRGASLAMPIPAWVEFDSRFPDDL